MTSRGCPFRCTFCTTSRMFAPYRRRSVDSVIAEIKHYKEMGFRYMNFEDDNFTADKDRAKEICRRIIAENLQFEDTFFFGRTDMANDPEHLDLGGVRIGDEAAVEHGGRAGDGGQNAGDQTAGAGFGGGDRQPLAPRRLEHGAGEGGNGEASRHVETFSR